MITALQNGNGKGTVTTGSPVSLATLATPQVTGRAIRVVITALDTNAGTIVVGNSTVVASPSASRVGVPLLPTFSQTFTVSSLNQLWIDGTNTGDGFAFYFEITT
jgi:hypothetical protein